MIESDLELHRRVFDSRVRISELSGETPCYWLREAIKRKWDHMGVVTPLSLPSDSPQEIKRFVTMVGAAIVMECGFAGEVRGYLYRAIREKLFYTAGLSRALFYTPGNTRGNWEEFSYGDRIFLAEGPMDAEFLALKFKYVLAYMTVRIRPAQAEWLGYWTNDVVVSPDNDEKGRESFRRTVWSLNKNGIGVSELKVPVGVKDWGKGFDVEGFDKYLNGPIVSVLKENFKRKEL